MVRHDHLQGQPGMRRLSISGLVLSGLAYGLGVGPVSYILMSTLHTQRMKSYGVTCGQVVKAGMTAVALKGVKY